MTLKGRGDLRVLEAVENGSEMASTRIFRWALKIKNQDNKNRRETAD
jgi:hypothetical protein